MKNCGKRFHLQVASKDFLNELVKVIGPKNDPPQIVQEKVLSLIQVCAKILELKIEDPFFINNDVIAFRHGQTHLEARLI